MEKSIVKNYEPIPFGEAKKNGIKAKATINGKEYIGYIYDVFFFHHVNDIGNCKILLRFCKNVRKI